jgi:hypothetical protein
MASTFFPDLNPTTEEICEWKHQELPLENADQLLKSHIDHVVKECKDCLEMYPDDDSLRMKTAVNGSCSATLNALREINQQSTSRKVIPAHGDASMQSIKASIARMRMMKNERDVGLYLNQLLLPLAATSWHVINKLLSVLVVVDHAHV